MSTVVSRWRSEPRPAPLFGVWQFTAHEEALRARLWAMLDAAHDANDFVRAGKVRRAIMRFYEKYDLTETETVLCRPKEAL